MKRLRLVLAILCSSFTACSTMKASIDIDAPAHEVWETISHFELYQDWNPFFVKGRGVTKEGEKIDLTMQPVGKSQTEFSPTILEVVDGQRIVWRGRLGIPGLFDGTHRLSVIPIDAHHSRFEQEEDFSGILVPFAGFDPYHQGWEKMNAALKTRCEGGRQ